MTKGAPTATALVVQHTPSTRVPGGPEVGAFDGFAALARVAAAGPRS